MRLAGLFLATFACAARAQTPVQAGDDDGLASPQAAGFRDRVVQLALIYGESSGIDPRDFKIVARQVGKQQAGCAEVEVLTLKGSDIVGRETVRACRAH